MILRKPYRFLIKNFRFIHFLLSIICMYFLIRTNEILKFFNTITNSKIMLVGTGTNKEYFNILMIIWMFVLITGMIIILTLLRRKEKPILIYFVNILIYLFTIGVFIYSNSVMEALETSILDIRTLKLSSDLVLVSFMLQMFTTANLFIRSLGFDLKKFEFGKDSEFEITDIDSEEFEFDIDFDKNKFKRKIKNNLRNMKYTYFENKFIINTLIIGTILFSAGYYVINNIILNKNYKQNEIVSVSDFNFEIVNTYITNKDYNNNVVTDNDLVIIKVRAKSKYGERKFETGKIQLTIGKQRYNITKDYNNKINDIGTPYNSKNIGSEFSEFILIYEVPEYDKDKKMVLKYQDVNGKSYNIKLKLDTFDKELESTSSKLNDTLKINDNIVKNLEFKITKYEISDIYSIPYSYCVTKNMCYDSTEYIAPKLTGRKIKSLMLLNTDMSDDIVNLIEKYGFIEYKIKGADIERKEKITEVKPTKVKFKNKKYFEVNDDIYDSSYIKLVINIRNQRYEYNLK